MYDLSKANNMHTYPKHKWVLNRVLYEKQMTQGFTCIFISFGQRLHIHEVKHENRQNKCKWGNHQN